MKDLSKFIKENLKRQKSTTGNFHLFKVTASTAKYVSEVESKLRQFCEFGPSDRKKPYSFFNTDDMKVMFDHFAKFSAIPDHILREFGIRSSVDIASLLVSNITNLKLAGWNFSMISCLDTSKTEKEYLKWRKSDEYTAGQSFAENADAFDDKLVRTIVIYDANWPGNPDTTIKYPFIGNRNEESNHRINLMKMDWRYLTGLEYFDARVCFYTYYMNKSEDELKQVELDLDNSDLKE